MVKYLLWWVLHFLIIFALFGATVSLSASDENFRLHEYDAVVVNTIQENHETSTDYYVVYKLSNGNVIDKEVNRTVYGSVKTGDNVVLELNKYDAGEAERGFNVFLQVLMMFMTAIYIIVGTMKILEDRKKYFKNNYDKRYY